MDDMPDHEDPFERDEWLASLEEAREEELNGNDRARWAAD